MSNGVKSCRQAEEDKDGEESRISCHEEVVGDFYECCFGAVKWAEAGLELFIKVIVG